QWPMGLLCSCTTEQEKSRLVKNRRKTLSGTINHSLALVVIPPGKSSDAHYHKASEETYYILKGVGLMIVDKQQFRLQPGQACLINPFEIHRIFNDGDDDLEFLAVSAPAWISSDSFFTTEEQLK